MEPAGAKHHRMEAVRRFDRGELSKPVKDPRTGYLRADGFITRAGVFDYRTPDGKVRRELRLPEEVFHADSIQSFDEVPVTNGHPPANLDISNTRKYQVGSTREPRQDGSHMRARLLVTDADTIAQAEGGKRDLSCGYTCELEMRSGITNGIDGLEDGLRFDAVQRNIRGNHVAILAEGRAGTSVSLRLDANDAIMSEDEHDHPTLTEPKPKETPMSNITKRIDGVDIEFTKQGAQAVEKLQTHCDGMTESVEAANTETEKEKARADKAEEDLAKLKTETEAQLSPEAIQKRVDARVALVTSAREVLGEKDENDKEIKLDGLADIDIKKLVIGKVSEVDLTEKAEAYVDARFDAALEEAAKQREDGGDLGGHKPPKPHPASSLRNPRTDGPTPDSSREKMIERNRNAWKGKDATN